MSLRIKQMLVIAGLVAFILFISNRDSYKNPPIDTVMESVEESDALGDMIKMSSTDIKKDYGFNINDYGEAFYYGYESIMDCDKVLIIRLNDESMGESIISMIDKKNDELKKLFQSYAPDQYTMLNNCVLTQKGNYVIYIVSDNAEKIEKTVIKCLKG